MMWTTQPRSNRAGLACVSVGEGPSLVMLHGVGLRAEAWNGQIEHLSTHFRITAPDMPGHGESPLDLELTRLSHYTDAIAKTLPGPSLLVGHSMGAMIALDLATRYPELVRGVAALNAIFQRSAEATAAIQRRADEMDGKAIADPTQTLMRWYGGEEHAEAAACRTWLTTVNPAGYANAYKVFAGEEGPTKETLSRIKCPAFFATGAKEPNSTPAMSEAMARHTARGTSLIVDGAAHMMPMTHRDIVNVALERFFADCTDGEPNAPEKSS